MLPAQPIRPESRRHQRQLGTCGQHGRRAFQGISRCDTPVRCADPYASGSAIVDRTAWRAWQGHHTAAYTALQSWMFKNRSRRRATAGRCWSTAPTAVSPFTNSRRSRSFPCPANESWRDPKLLFTEEGKLCIAVYETFEGKNCVSFYSSENCTDWKFESRSPDLFECPDLFPLPVAGAEEQLWVLYGADGDILSGNSGITVSHRMAAGAISITVRRSMPGRHGTHIRTGRCGTILRG